MVSGYLFVPKQESGGVDDREKNPMPRAGASILCLKTIFSASFSRISSVIFSRFRVFFGSSFFLEF